MIDEWKGGLDVLPVFPGLFSAAVTLIYIQCSVVNGSFMNEISRSGPDPFSHLRRILSTEFFAVPTKQWIHWHQNKAVSSSTPREKFRGEAKDDVDALDIGLPESYNEDNDEEEQRGEKLKVEVPPPPPITSVPAGTPVVPEKRNCGRPSEVIPPVALVGKIGAKPEAQSQAPQNLLVTFALFLFFNNHFSTTASTSEHAYEGVVLSARPHSTVGTNQSLIQAFHLLVSALVFISILWPWVGKIKSRFNFNLRAFRAAKEVRGQFVTRTAGLLAASEPAKRGKQGEVKRLTKALG
ncbi:hypothetical protein EDD18DRAFT_1388445 [Armillaria luteobubalina]|uniref:Uncharacterized protein n=1 Tax=Armillaria luteobubalina TaxID=153913 RepID=A0AA39Q5D4_9AGAR|nr:hypothetical protein EDD18DRAFT_1388445 [Armillaria luteobubalina]